MSEAQKYAVEMRGITKRFGEVVANRNLNIAVPDRSIHAIIGENGAGKSTLMKLLAGHLQPTRPATRIKKPEPCGSGHKRICSPFQNIMPCYSLLREACVRRASSAIIRAFGISATAFCT